MQLKEYILFSSWVNRENETIERILKSLKESKGIPHIIKDRILSVITKQRVIKANLYESFKLGRIGTNPKAYDYFVVVNIEQLTNSQVTAFDSFWVGFLAGIDFKKMNW